MGSQPEKISPRGWIYLALWGVLILLGIMEKRIYDHPDRMAFFHLPAAVFLVLALRELSRNFRKKHQEAWDRFNQTKINT